jgi:hypothetical protein
VLVVPPDTEVKDELEATAADQSADWTFVSDEETVTV